MFTSQRAKPSDPHVIALVELDLQKIRVRIVWAREAIRERMRELERAKDHRGEGQGSEATPDSCELEKNQARTPNQLASLWVSAGGILRLLPSTGALRLGSQRGYVSSQKNAKSEQF